MFDRKINVGLISNSRVREVYLSDKDLNKLKKFANFFWMECNEESSWDHPPVSNKEVINNIKKFSRDLDALVVCHGSPLIDDNIMKNCDNLKFIGELEGDRFSQRVDLDAAFNNNIVVVDTTNGCSAAVAEWALGLILIGLLNGGAHFRKLSQKKEWGTVLQRFNDPIFQWNEELSGKKIGMIGLGYIGRKLSEFLRPFNVDIYAHDPYVPLEIASFLDITLTSLENVMAIPDVVVCLAPLTPSTEGLLGTKELNLIKSGAVFVNVSRGKIVDSDALIKRLEVKDIVACLDVFDPEPVPVDSQIRAMENVFLSPHIAGTTLNTRREFFSEMIKELSRFHSGHINLHSFNQRIIANRSGKKNY